MITQNIRFPRRRGALAAAALLAGAAVAVFGAGIASAAVPDDVPSLTVQYGDLNLDTDSGARTLYARLQRAATSVCPAGFTRDLSAAAAERRCRDEAVARAVEKINNARLTKLSSTHMKVG
jgi:UrcA family protein